MAMEIDPISLKAGVVWLKYFQDLMKQLENKGKINPNRVKEMKKIKKRVNFANQSALHINEIDGIVRDAKVRAAFLKKNSELEEDLLYEVWFNLLVVATLRSYWFLEISLINLLKDVSYGKKGIVEGNENLGKLKKIIEEYIGVNNRIDWDAIDITFRNSLAHGWYLRDKQKFIFYRNSKLTHGKQYSWNKLITKSKMVQLYALAIGGLVGNWENEKSLGSKDPLRKKTKGK